MSEDSKKPIALWIALGAIAMSIVYFLLSKTPSVIIVSLLLIFVLLIHPLWNFWWIEKTLLRRIIACVFFVTALVLLGYIVWPTPATLVQPSSVEKEIPNKKKEARKKEPPVVFPTQSESRPSKEPTKEEGKAILHFTFWPVGANETLLDTIAVPIEKGVVMIDVTAKNIGNIGANNGIMWIQICNGCRFAEEPKGSQAIEPPDDVVRRRRFTVPLYPGIYFDPNRLKIIPPSGIGFFFIAFNYACEHCPPVDNTHPQLLRVNIIK
jgi:hypothetical protein